MCARECVPMRSVLLGVCFIETIAAYFFFFCLIFLKVVLALSSWFLLQGHVLQSSFYLVSVLNNITVLSEEHLSATAMIFHTLFLFSVLLLEGSN